jgi:hypothetical protein
MAGPRLLSGGNPQIPKGYGEEPISAYLDAVPGWKQAVCRRIDEIVSAEVPGVVKAVKWNSPMYGREKDCWFLSFHCYDKYVKVSFYRGAELSPPPKETSKYPAIRRTSNFVFPRRRLRPRIARQLRRLLSARRGRYRNASGVCGLFAGSGTPISGGH